MHLRRLESRLVLTVTLHRFGGESHAGSGTHLPSLETAQRLAVWLGIPLEEVVRLAKERVGG